MELSPPRMTDEEIIETLKEFVFGNFDVSRKVREAIDEVIVRMETKSNQLGNYVLNVLGNGVVPSRCRVRLTGSPHSCNTRL